MTAQEPTEPTKCDRCGLKLGYTSPEDCGYCDRLCPIWGTHGHLWTGDEEESRALFLGVDFGSQPDRTVIVGVRRDDDGSLTIVEMNVVQR